MIRISADAPPVQTSITIEEVTDPEEVAKSRKAFDQAERNMNWLQSHWQDLLPGVLGKFLAVAGQEAYLAESSAKAAAMARVAHPDDRGLLLHYISPEQGPRIYGTRRSAVLSPESGGAAGSLNRPW
jgi:hypothetical protein